jgi:protein involved in polysaccharide export with SLBB domain
MPNDNFPTLLALAGGITRRADTSRASLLAGINGEKRQLNSFKAGDIIRIPTRNDERTNTVLIIGAVTTPGRYELQPDMTIGKLLEVSGGGTERANLSRITIFRLAETDEGVDDLGDRYPIVIASEDLPDTPVKPLDSVVVPRMVGWVRVTGAVRSPGMLPYMAGKDASYYISAAGGYLPEADARNIKIFDRISHVRISVSINGQVQDGDEVVVESITKGQP